MPALARAIAATALRDVNGYLCRAVRSKHLNRKPPEPLYFLASARDGARFTPVGGPAGLYLANHQEVALAEIRDVAFDAAGKRRPLRRRDAVTLVTALTRVRGVLDLTDPAVCHRVGVTPAEVTAEWADVLEAYLAGRGPLPLTQQIGRAAHLTGRVRGILFPPPATQAASASASSPTAWTTPTATWSASAAPTASASPDRNLTQRRGAAEKRSSSAAPRLCVR